MKTKYKFSNQGKKNCEKNGEFFSKKELMELVDFFKEEECKTLFGVEAIEVVDSQIGVNTFSY
jgi:hypothetical protein